MEKSAKSVIEARLQVIGLPSKCSLASGETYTKKWDTHLKKFTLDMENYYYENKQTRQELNQKLNILEDIEKYLAENTFVKPIGGIQYEIKAVVPFGSSACGLGMTGGDLDMTVCVYPPIDAEREEEVKTRSNTILTEIFKDIRSGKMLAKRKLKKMEHIDGARVPIITGEVDGVELDISISMTKLVSAQYLSAKFIDAYEKYDRRFLLLAAYVKYWQKSKKTDQNELFYDKVFPKSCCVVLMVICFMKYYKLLPNVNKRHEDKLGLIRATWEMVNGGEEGAFGLPREDVRNWKESHFCDVSLGTLFLLYLDFYTEIVKFRRDKLMVEDGSFRRKRKDERKHEIVIEDVIDKSNTARSLVHIGAFRRMLYDATRIVENSEPLVIEEELLDVKFYNPGVMKRRRRQLREQGFILSVQLIKYPR